MVYAVECSGEDHTGSFGEQQEDQTLERIDVLQSEMRDKYEPRVKNTSTLVEDGKHIAIGYVYQTVEGSEFEKISVYDYNNTTGKYSVLTKKRNTGAQVRLVVTEAELKSMIKARTGSNLVKLAIELIFDLEMLIA